MYEKKVNLHSTVKKILLFLNIKNALILLIFISRRHCAVTEYVEAV